MITRQEMITMYHVFVSAISGNCAFIPLHDNRGCIRTETYREPLPRCIFRQFTVLTDRIMLIRIVRESTLNHCFTHGDTIVKYRFFHQALLLLPLFLLCGCASQISVEDRSRNWIARPLSELKAEMNNPNSYASKIGWNEKTYPLANGNMVYIEPVGDNCSIHWEVNQGGLIINYTAKGHSCKPQDDSNSRIINTRTSSQ